MNKNFIVSSFELRSNLKKSYKKEMSLLKVHVSLFLWLINK